MVLQCSTWTHSNSGAVKVFCCGGQLVCRPALFIMFFFGWRTGLVLSWLETCSVLLACHVQAPSSLMAFACLPWLSSFELNGLCLHPLTGIFPSALQPCPLMAIFPLVLLSRPLTAIFPLALWPCLLMAIFPSALPPRLLMAIFPSALRPCLLKVIFYPALQPRLVGISY